MPKIYILCGPIASGKTTFYKKFKANNPNTILLSHDELMLRLNSKCVGRDEHLRLSMNISKYFAKLSYDLINANLNVILDYGFWTKDERILIKNELDNLNISYELIYFNVDKNERLKRLLKRNIEYAKENERQYIIDEEKFNVLEAYFEVPDNEEVSRIINE